MEAIVQAPAKLTLSLRITGVRDDGYHLIDSEMTLLDLADTVTFGPDGSRGLTVDGPFAAGVPIDESNLAAKALRLVDQQVAVHIHKRIPNGGGLGGGSADAAAVLRWANFSDLVAAARLGADVPFCLVGGRARVRGIGEDVMSLPPRPEAVTLIIPPLRCSTPAVYRAWDELGGPRADGVNDLEPAAISVEPRLATWRDRIRSATDVQPVLAGSGATWFIYGHHPDLALVLPDATVVTATTVAR
jgi:4-diphosphocytidyl-2-C-methyl-D-erythritol kinase